MLNDMQMDRMLVKLTRLETTLEPYLFRKVGEMDTRMLETAEQLHAIPDPEGAWRPVRAGDSWGGAWRYAWFAGEVRVPAGQAGQKLYLRPDVGGYEAMLWVDGRPYGTYATKIVQTGHGNHYCNLIAHAADPDRPIQVAVEFYAGHSILGTQPFETNPPNDWRHVFRSMDICVKQQDVADFLFDLRTLNQLAAGLDPLSFRRAQVQNCLLEVFRTVWLSVEQVDESVWRTALARAREIMAPVLAAVNPASAPVAGLVGHSHMDTAWLWPIRETVKKCARTFSNQISLMEQYPEYRFIQSSAYHLDMMCRHYPRLFDDIRGKVAQGRYEPNGGVWVECDCNLTSGESMIRQFLWGQRYTRTHFGYTADTFWLPDTFGYSAAIPQLMKGCDIRYFLTTKLSWNDTNRFPYETFWWEGIDGTRVLTHFNTTHCWPEPKALLEQLEGRSGSNSIRNKRVSNRRLMAYGFGDGGGGPQFEMIEMARRVGDLEGVPKAVHTSVSAFMQALGDEAGEMPVHQGELYLELHRGTLTNQHEIKWNNRKAEWLLHHLEFLTVREAVNAGLPASGELLRPLMETLLVNQFHDILPGTCIPEVHDECHAQMRQLLAEGTTLLTAMTGLPLDNGLPEELTEAHRRTDAAGEIIPAGMGTGAEQCVLSVVNPIGLSRQDAIPLPGFGGWKPVDPSLPYQTDQDLHGRECLVIGGLLLPAFSGTAIALTAGTASTETGLADSTPFRYGKDILETPYALIHFDAAGAIDSFVDKRNGRELRGSGAPLNTFWLAEDLPASWDNWDVDADIAYRYEAPAVLERRELVSSGPVLLRLRSWYRLTDRTRMVQDLVVFADSPQVVFETELDWQDKHRFLKAGFDTSIRAAHARHEIQFGYSLKPTTRNNSLEQAMFEVLNHRYTDLSETRYGVALLNDCKYGISVEGGDLRLSLHKGGCRPDPRGDAGVHRFTYALLPHLGGFSAENAVLPGYCLNAPVIPADGSRTFPSLVSADTPHVVVETIKPCEDMQRAFLIRLYECEGTRAVTSLTFGIPVREVVRTNLLEEPLGEPLPVLAPIQGHGQAVLENLQFAPFEIQTFRVAY